MLQLLVQLSRDLLLRALLGLEREHELMLLPPPRESALAAINLDKTLRCDSKMTRRNARVDASSTSESV